MEEKVKPAEVEDMERMIGIEEEEIKEKIAEAFDEASIENFLTDLLVFDYITKNNGVVTVTQEDMEKVEEMRRTRAIEFISEVTEDGKKVLIARFIYHNVEGEGDEKVNNN